MDIQPVEDSGDELYYFNVRVDKMPRIVRFAFKKDPLVTSSHNPLPKIPTPLPVLDLEQIQHVEYHGTQNFAPMVLVIAHFSAGLDYEIVSLTNCIC